MKVAIKHPEYSICMIQIYTILGRCDTFHLCSDSRESGTESGNFLILRAPLSARDRNNNTVTKTKHEFATEQGISERARGSEARHYKFKSKSVPSDID
jgi:hypothetical protein